eukprot:CAMPEP_0201690092 /NCGR_PEP_ID=MMETSP0578-20130828/3565_1 /ASSEMBLY_ACC=CAM_ASM_000663 /TAXON_ID=267565 /ORGANISM="Skeletonema grethea, Strain CCMP 1804" /LENGTH=133 /DNA_ID=CAMNT_0048174947 /DNA_START=193 /DNA_END=591 /DNA_ORIENTATION=+
MPTLMEVNDGPEKVGILTPRDAKKPPVSAVEIPLLDSEESNDGKLLSNGNIRVDKKTAKSGKENASSSNKKGKSRKRSGRQISIFESIGADPPPTGTVLTPSTDTGNLSNAGESSIKKKKKRRTMNPNEDAFP